MSRRILVLVCLCVILLAGCAPRGAVTYRVRSSGSITDLQLLYTDARGDVGGETVRAPWERSLGRPPAGQLMLTVQPVSMFEGGEFTCAILVDGRIVASDTSGPGKRTLICGYDMDDELTP